MTIKIGINGFGRIGRNFFRAAKQLGAGPGVRGGERHHRRQDAGAPAQVRLGPRHVRRRRRASARTASSVDGDELRVLAERDPANLPWKELGADIVIESTGLFTDAARTRPSTSTPARRRS